MTRLHIELLEDLDALVVKHSPRLNPGEYMSCVLYHFAMIAKAHAQSGDAQEIADKTRESVLQILETI